MANAKPEGPFTRILVATRGSPWSQRALELGLRMAKAYDVELVVAAILTPMYVPERGAPWGLGVAPAVSEDVKQLAQRVLDHASTLAAAYGLRYICEMREGRPAEEIIKATEQHQCDLIIIGSRGLSGVRRVTMGETGNEVVLKAPTPVIVVK
jgi:nucleotide-binding universal stress UspA family protein